MTRAVPRFRYAVRALSVALTVVGAVAATRLPAPALTVGLTLPLRGSPPAAGNHGTGNTAVDMASASYLPSAGFSGDVGVSRCGSRLPVPPRLPVRGMHRQKGKSISLA